MGRQRNDNTGKRGLNVSESKNQEGSASGSENEPLGASVNIQNSIQAALYVPNKDPNKNYRWVRKTRKGKDIELRKFQGYTPVPKDKGGREVGDLVLMWCPKEAWEERRRMQQKRTKAMDEAAARQFKQMARKYGVPINEEYRRT